ncbi:MAG: response regulator RpfG family c-di-GMP phosphodiesterase [Psychromonas sp.]|jgi:response regulator RpfG family c-di-GMP phosphodiesterase|uniref:HD-GYP domain-containing protein n=1 Tax=Psychromonas sp. TaxID=1884585 RepID=UPI0039E528D5
MNLKPHYRIVLIYLILGMSWIFFSDLVVEQLFRDKASLIIAQSIKGWFFIIITGLLLFFLIRKDVNARQEVNLKLVESYDQTISGWVHVMDLRHRETKDHTQRVTKMTVELAKLSGIREAEKLKCIERGAMLHDIGKIGIPDSILIKPGKLDEKEWVTMKTHPQIAYDILSKIVFLKPSVDIPFFHHERWDGTGYPKGMKGKEIPITARFFAVIDVWDALIHPRVYKSAWPEEKVLEHIRAQSETHFDPDVVTLFLDNYKQIKESSQVS